MTVKSWHDLTYPIFERVTLSFEGVTLSFTRGVTLAFVTRGVTLDLERVTLSFFARVSPLVQAHAGGAGAPDFGGLLFARGVLPSTSGPSTSGGEERRGSARDELTLPFLPELTLSFSNLPYTFSRCAA